MKQGGNLHWTLGGSYVGFSSQITLFEINRDIVRIKQICKKEGCTYTVIGQLTFAEQAQLKEKAIKGLDSMTKSIEGKIIQTDESEE